MKKAETWPSALVGHGQLDPFATEEIRKKMMLERFQEEVSLPFSLSSCCFLSSPFRELRSNLLLISIIATRLDNISCFAKLGIIGLNARTVMGPLLGYLVGFNGRNDLTIQ